MYVIKGKDEFLMNYGNKSLTEKHKIAGKIKLYKLDSYSSCSWSDTVSEALRFNTKEEAYTVVKNILETNSDYILDVCKV